MLAGLLVEPDLRLAQVAVHRPRVRRPAGDVLVAEVLGRHRRVGRRPLQLGRDLVVESCDRVETLAHVWQSTAVEAPLESTEHGLVAAGEGWFVVNACEARWFDRGPRGAVCNFQGETTFPQLGVNLFVLGPGQPMSMFHWEADQEDFLVLSGEALLIVEGEERPLVQWDLAHTPAGVPHTIVGAGAGPCAILAVGARANQGRPGWGGYPVDETARRHDASAEQDTTDPREAYARFPARVPSRYRDGWLPD